MNSNILHLGRISHLTLLTSSVLTTFQARALSGLLLHVEQSILAVPQYSKMKYILQTYMMYHNISSDSLRYEHGGGVGEYARGTARISSHLSNLKPASCVGCGLMA